MQRLHLLKDGISFMKSTRQAVPENKILRLIVPNFTFGRGKLGWDQIRLLWHLPITLFGLGLGA